VSTAARLAPGFIVDGTSPSVRVDAIGLAECVVNVRACLHGLLSFFCRD
jgi:hypothetical protein